jgi:hypothetical protein
MSLEEILAVETLEIEGEGVEHQEDGLEEVAGLEDEEEAAR